MTSCWEWGEEETSVRQLEGIIVEFRDARKRVVRPRQVPYLLSDSILTVNGAFPWT